ncbi:MAG: thioredoxin family protein [Bacteroidota bacterium]
MKKSINIVFTSGLMMMGLLIGGAQSGCNAKGSGAESSDSAAVEMALEAQALEGHAASDSTIKVAGDTAAEQKKAVSGKLQWYEYADGYNKAKAENKILLVDAYTDWCGWCKVMDRETYTNAAVIAALNQDFVCVKFNPEVEMTHSFGKYNLKSNELLYWLSNGQPGGYPTSYFVFHPAKNDERASQAGYLPPDQFLKLLAEVKKRH